MYSLLYMHQRCLLSLCSSHEFSNDHLQSIREQLMAANVVVNMPVHTGGLTREKLALAFGIELPRCR